MIDEDVTWETMLQLINAHLERVYPDMFKQKNDKLNGKIEITPLNFPNHFRRPKCQKCGNLVARKPSSLKLWRQRKFLCRKCFQQKNKTQEFPKIGEGV
jgi:formylmethanofuran dehydrogenase subunit E